MFVTLEHRLRCKSSGHLSAFHFTSTCCFAYPILLTQTLTIPFFLIFLRVSSGVLTPYKGIAVKYISSFIYKSIKRQMLHLLCSIFWVSLSLFFANFAYTVYIYNLLQLPSKTLFRFSIHSEQSIGNNHLLSFHISIAI